MQVRSRNCHTQTQPVFYIKFYQVFKEFVGSTKNKSLNLMVISILLNKRKVILLNRNPFSSYPTKKKFKENEQIPAELSFPICNRHAIIDLELIWSFRQQHSAWRYIYGVALSHREKAIFWSTKLASISSSWRRSYTILSNEGKIYLTRKHI